MSEIHESIHVSCPFERAPAYLRAYLDRHESPNGRTAILMMRLPVSDITVERAIEVSLTSRPAHLIGNVFDVLWSAQGGGPYPSFAGELVFHRDGDETCLMALDGAYEPPGGALGKGFDAVVGKRIAAAGVRTLLADLQHEIECSFREYVERISLSDSPTYPPTYE